MTKLLVFEMDLFHTSLVKIWDFSLKFQFWLVEHNPVK